MVWAAALILSAATPVGGATTFSTLAKACSQPAETIGDGFCLGYIDGVLARDEAARILDPGTEKVCKLTGVTRQAVLDAVKSHVSTNPQDADIPASVVVLIAVRETFCRK